MSETVADNTRPSLSLFIRLYLCVELFKLTGKAKKIGVVGPVRAIIRDAFQRIRQAIAGPPIGMG